MLCAGLEIDVVSRVFRREIRDSNACLEIALVSVVFLRDIRFTTLVWK